MKKIFPLIISFAFLTNICFASPSNSISIPNSFSPNTTISSSQVNANFNEGQTKFNTHSHTDITQVGVITSGTWQGTAIDETYGGTGSDFSATAQGNIFYFSGTGTVATLAPGTANYILKTGGAGANPSWTNQAPDADTLDTYSTATAATASSIYVSGGDGYLPDATVDTTALKTATGEVTSTSAGENVTLPGGTYAFFPQTKISSATSAYIYLFRGEFTGAVTTYTTFLGMSVGGGQTLYAQSRYVTASGQDYWLFICIDRITKDPILMWAAPDHPAYGNGGDFDKLPHPFGSYDETKHEIILVDNDTIAELKAQVTEEKSLLTLVNEDYKVGNKDLEYKPLHSGKFINQKPELVQTIPDYIKVRKLQKMTATEKTEKKAKIEQKTNEINQEKINKENKIKAKLNLTDTELSELKDILK